MEPCWAVVELMGHVRLAGKLSEEEMFGTKMGRLDIPLPPDKTCPLCQGQGYVRVGAEMPSMPCDACRSRFVTQYFGGSSVYRITPCDEETARRQAGCLPEPVHRYQSSGEIGYSRDTNDPYGDECDDEEDDDRPF